MTRCSSNPRASSRRPIAHLQSHMPAQLRSRTLGVLATCAGVIALCAIYGDLRVADFHGDDWHFVALLRHINSPLDILTSNVALNYLYRPASLLTIWLSQRVLGDTPQWHYLVNVALHAWVALEMWLIARDRLKDSGVAASVVVLFLVFPANAATPLWISDRFDLLATGAMLCAIRKFQSWQTSPQESKQLIGSLFSALIALNAKETGYALSPVLAVLAAFWAAPDASFRYRALFGIISVTALALMARVYALSGVRGDESLSLSISVVADGVFDGSQAWPQPRTLAERLRSFWPYAQFR